MSTVTLASILVQAEQLSQDDQLLLIAHLATSVRRGPPSTSPSRQWRDLRGLLPPMSNGEDAQDWVSRTRRESDEQREQQWLVLDDLQAS